MDATLDLSLVSEFRSSGSEWKGSEKHLSLFEFWKKHSDIDTSTTEPDNEVVIGSSDFQHVEVDSATIELDNEVLIDLSDVHIIEGDDYDQLINSIALNCKNSPETLAIICEKDSQSSEEESETSPDHTNGMEVNLLKENSEPVDRNVLASHTSNVQTPPGITPFFRDTIFWPDRIPSKKNVEKKREVPAVLIAEEHIDFLKNKRREKDELEQLKADRKRKREENKKKKEQEVLEKKRKAEIAKVLRIEKLNLEAAVKLERKSIRIKKLERKRKSKELQNKKNGGYDKGKKSEMDCNAMEPVCVEQICEADTNVK